eukprot:374213-Prymnesium_polylepis.1
MRGAWLLREMRGASQGVNRCALPNPPDALSRLANPPQVAHASPRCARAPRRSRHLRSARRARTGWPTRRGGAPAGWRAASCCRHPPPRAPGSSRRSPHGLRAGRDGWAGSGAQCGAPIKMGEQPSWQRKGREAWLTGRRATVGVAVRSVAGAQCGVKTVTDFIARSGGGLVSVVLRSDPQKDMSCRLASAECGSPPGLVVEKERESTPSTDRVAAVRSSARMATAAAAGLKYDSPDLMKWWFLSSLMSNAFHSSSVNSTLLRSASASA